MKYRQFGRLDWKPSALGFGCMRLPLRDSDMSHIDEDEAIRMIRHAIDHGLNYVDTAAPYHVGNSERVVGKALRDGYRQKVRLATKLTPDMLSSGADFERFFNNQLERLQTDKIDFYLLHGLNRKLWASMKEWRAIPWVEKKIAVGQVGHLGFSFHDDYAIFKEIVDYYDNWTFCQIQYNYMDVKYQAGRRGLKYAAGKGLAVVIMEPIRGGALAKEPPKPVARVWQKAPGRRSRAEWALQWLWDQPEVSVVLSGMSTMEQVVENLASAGRSAVGQMTKDELAFLDRVREAYHGYMPVPCTKCNYCMPCPNGVAIPEIFEMFNQVTMYEDLTFVPFGYMGFGPGSLTEGQRADSCQECQECLEKCPQQIDIPAWLKKAHQKLYVEDFQPPPPPSLD